MYKNHSIYQCKFTIRHKIYLGINQKDNPPINSRSFNDFPECMDVLVISRDIDLQLLNILTSLSMCV